MSVKETISRMETTLSLLSIRESPHGFEPAATKAYASDVLAAMIAQDAVALLAHYRDEVTA